MKIEKEQRNQFIVLCVLLVVVVGFGAYRMVGTGTKASSDTPTPVAAAHALRQSNKPGPAQAAPGEEGTAVAFVQPVKDPFTPQFVPSDEKSETVADKPARNVPLIMQETKMPLPVMPIFGSQPAKISATPLVDQVNPVKDLIVTGVIEGEVNVAIIRCGEARHIVREGQAIGGGLVVRYISRAGVRLRGNGRGYFLPLSSGKGS